MTHSKVIVIAGATGGIGRALVEDLSTIASQMVLISKSSNKLSMLGSVLNSKKVKAESFSIDFRNTHNAEIELERIAASLSSLDVLINCTGTFLSSPIETIDLPTWDDLINVNLTSHFLTIRSFLPIMKKNKKGLIINFSSIGGVQGLKDKAAYCASKYAVRGLTNALREECKPFFIKCLTISPFLVDSENQIDFKNLKNPEMSILDPSDISGVIKDYILKPHRLAINDLILKSLL
jgi:3-oxoacyl-[acyl-carrier protein] reductase